MSDLIASGAVSSDSVSETAKMVQEIVRAGVTLGQWVGGILGTVPADLVQIAGGMWVHETRIRNGAIYAAKTEALLEKIAKERRTEPSPSVVIPLLEAARDESREELQNIWAALLANSVIDGGKKVRVAFFDVVKKMEPADAHVLNMLAQPDRWSALPEKGHTQFERMEAEAAAYGVADDLAISISALHKLGCLFNSNMGAVPPVTPFGRGLLAACTVT